MISTKSERRLLVALSLLAVLAGLYWFKNKRSSWLLAGAVMTGGVVLLRPLRAPRRSKSDLAAVVSHEIRTPMPAKRAPRVLVAEDNRINQKVARGLLHKMGYEVEMVGTGREAVEAAGKGSYAAILMDCGMPEMDGYDATREIRRLYNEFQRTPVIAMTGAATLADEQRCRMAGMDDYLTKPVDVEQLRKTLQRWI